MLSGLVMFAVEGTILPSAPIEIVPLASTL